MASTPGKIEKRKDRFMKYLALIGITLLLHGCSPDANQPDPGLHGGWNELPDEVVASGVGKDGIGSLTSPAMVSTSEGTWLPDSAFVVGLVSGGQAYAYPRAILDHHEVVNEPERETPYTLSFCPLTGSAVVFESDPGNGVLEFGVSGLLLQNNLIMYDRETESFWPQLRLQCDRGAYVNRRFRLLPATELTWDAWKRLHPETLVLSRDTGFFRDYTPEALYGKYRSLVTAPPYSMKHKDDRLEFKYRVLGVYAGNSSKAYPFKRFSQDRNVINDVIDGVPVAVYADKKAKLIRAFVRRAGGRTLTLEIISGSGEGTINDVRFRDIETGTIWNVLGEAFDGTLAGEQLKTPDSFVAYWFAWSAFNRDTELWEG